MTGEGPPIRAEAGGLLEARAMKGGMTRERPAWEAYSPQNRTDVGSRCQRPGQMKDEDKNREGLGVSERASWKRRKKGLEGAWRGSRGKDLGWAEVGQGSGGLALLLFPLLSSLVVTGATSGIGKAYAHEVNQDLEPSGWWGLLLSVCLLSAPPTKLRIVCIIWALRCPLFQEAFPLLTRLGQEVFTLGFYSPLTFSHHCPDLFSQNIFIDNLYVSMLGLQQ